MRRPVVAAVAATLVAVLSGCAKHVAYTPPSAPVPPAFREDPPLAFKESGQWKQADPADAFARGEWWTIFHDPDLDKLERQVDVSNENLRVVQARYGEARAYVAQQKSARFPLVSTGPQITGQRFSNNKTLAPPANLNNYGDFMLPVDLSYELDVWGRVRNVVAAAAQSAQASAADLETVRLSLHAEVAADYFNLRGLDEEGRILNGAVDAYAKALELTQSRFDGGIANRAEVEEAKTQVEATRAQAIDVTEKRAQLEHALAVLTGQPPENFHLPGKPGRLEPPVIPAGLPSTLLERRPDIAGAERRVASANSEVGYAKASFYPQLVLSLTGGFEGGSIASWLAWPSRLWAIGPSAVQPLFDAGRRRAELDQARANYDATVANYRQQVLGAFQQVEDNLASLRILEEEAERQERAITAARRAEELSMERYKGGLVTYLEVVTAQNIRLQNERAGVDLQRRRMEASVYLVKALGGGWDAKSLPVIK